MSSSIRSMRNHRILPTVVLLMMFAASCASSGTGFDIDSNSAEGESVEIPVSAGDSVVADAVSLASVVEYQITESAHIDPPATFAQSPSVGGDHYPFWQNCGFYTALPVEGAATHSMEHGAVWVTYNNAELAEGELEALAAMAIENDRLLITPWDQDEKLVLSSWGAQLRLPNVSVGDPVIDAFIDAYADRDGIPEPNVSCQGALGEPPENARTLSDGSILDAVWS